jgi:hypothetical protein
MDYPVDVVALQEELRLPLVAREAVDDEAVVPVVLAEPLLHDAVYEVIADQQSRRHRAPDLRAELGVVLHVPPEDIPDSDVLEVEALGEHFRVSSLATALDAHDDVFPHTATLARNRAAGGWPRGYAAARWWRSRLLHRLAVKMPPPRAYLRAARYPGQASGRNRPRWITWPASRRPDPAGGRRRGSCRPARRPV